MIKAATFCLATTLGLTAGIWLDRTEPSPVEQIACYEAGGVPITSSTGNLLCIRHDALLDPQRKLNTAGSSLSRVRN